MNELKHVGMIMDGNRRWAKKNGLKTVLMGHESGAHKLMDVCEWCEDLEIPFLSVYAFSTENWNRAEWEINGLFQILEKFLREQLQNCLDHGIRILVVGDRKRLPARIMQEILNAEEQTRDCSRLTVHIAISYGGKDELTRAVRKMASDLETGKLKKEEISEAVLEGYLDTAGTPMMDMVIRTGGNHRLSNFFIWQTAYSELYFTDTLWPDFTLEEFRKFVDDYRGTNINLGK